MKKNRKQLKREKKNLRRLNEMKRQNASSKKEKSSKVEWRDMLILFVEGSNDLELNSRLIKQGVFLKDLVWLSDISDPYIGKTFYNPNNRVRNKNKSGYVRLSQQDIQELRDSLNPLKKVAWRSLQMIVVNHYRLWRKSPRFSIIITENEERKWFFFSNLKIQNMEICYE